MKNRASLKVEQLESRLTPSFGSPTNYAITSGANPPVVALANVDGSQGFDLLTLNQNGLLGDTLAVRLNNGSGTFGTLNEYVTGGANPSHLAVADLDGDSDLDVVVAHASGVSVHFNNGSGDFSSKTDYSDADGNVWVALGDLDGDGDTDLVAIELDGGGDLTVRFNNGSGVFGSGTDYDVQGGGSEGEFVRLANIDGSNGLDLVYLDNDGNLHSRLNNGSGSFGSETDYNFSSLFAFDMNDIDGDGDSDVVGIDLAQDGDVAILIALNNGSGSFSETVYDTGIDPGDFLPLGIVIADLDGDSDRDVAFCLENDDVFGVAFNSSGSFTSGATYSTGDGPVAIAAADVDGDSDIDIATANVGGDNVSVMLNT